ncbi:uncharacterized protein LOC130957129 [Arachis stenosperma]|uniref:uncharacterized protein LOC130957129 n=1 Tax=Arachis stenosperma TaxID=217475 RepID=UPI0025AC9F8A|nr:uncharacterized protein LOC130957129 [Arachis stenosperma]
MGTKRRNAVTAETQKLLDAGFIRKLRFSSCSVLVTETGKEQHPVYFVRKLLQNAKTIYPTIEKLAFGLVITAWRLRHYFQTHQIIVRFGQPLRQILSKLDLAGQLTKWAIELSEFDISYQSRGSPKVQALTDFISEFTNTEEMVTKWELYVNGASNESECGAGILLKGNTGVHVKQSIKFLFQATNNQAEYEAFLVGLRLAREVKVKNLKVYCDSLLVVQQVTGHFHVRDPLLEKYLNSAKNMIQHFQNFEISHIPREQNCRANILSKLAIYRVTNSSDKLSHLTLTKPSLDIKSVLSVSQEEDWRNPFICYLRTVEIPENENPMSFRHKAIHYTMMGADLYKRGISRPLLKCLGRVDAENAIAEIHDGICGHHARGRSLATKIVRAGYYWPTLREDCRNKVQKCDACQKCVPLIHSPIELLHTLDISWPFHKWGMDILGPFPVAPGQVKFLLVAIDYFTK